jgi:PAS domain S-box-containing protein
VQFVSGITDHTSPGSSAASPTATASVQPGIVASPRFSALGRARERRLRSSSRASESTSVRGAHVLKACSPGTASPALSARSAAASDSSGSPMLYPDSGRVPTNNQLHINTDSPSFNSSPNMHSWARDGSASPQVPTSLSAPLSRADNTETGSQPSIHQSVGLKRRLRMYKGEQSRVHLHASCSRAKSKSSASASAQQAKSSGSPNSSSNNPSTSIPSEVPVSAIGSALWNCASVSCLIVERSTGCIVASNYGAQTILGHCPSGVLFHERVIDPSTLGMQVVEQDGRAFYTRSWTELLCPNAMQHSLSVEFSSPEFVRKTICADLQPSRIQTQQFSQQEYSMPYPLMLRYIGSGMPTAPCVCSQICAGACIQCINSDSKLASKKSSSTTATTSTSTSTSTSTASTIAPSTNRPNRVVASRAAIVSDGDSDGDGVSLPNDDDISKTHAVDPDAIDLSTTVSFRASDSTKAATTLTDETTILQQQLHTVVPNPSPSASSGGHFANAPAPTAAGNDFFLQQTSAAGVEYRPDISCKYSHETGGDDSDDENHTDVSDNTDGETDDSSELRPSSGNARDVVVGHVYVRCTLVPLKSTHHLVLLQDITDDVARHQASQQEIQHVIQLCASAHDGMWMFNAQTNQVLLTDEFAECLGYVSLAELYADGQSWESVLHEDDRDVVSSVWDSFLCSGIAERVQTRLRFIHRDGSIVYVMSATYPRMCDSTGLQVLVGFNTDVTQLNVAVDAVVMAAEAKTNYLACMSHEIRTPLNGIIGTVDLMHDQVRRLINLRRKQTHPSSSTSDINGFDALLAENEELISITAESSSHLLRVLNDVLDFSKIEAGKMLIEQQTFSLMDATQGQLQALITRGGQLKKGVEFQSVTSGKVPQFVVGDSVRLLQILLNLISNSIKFTSIGHIRVTTSWNRNANFVRSVSSHSANAQHAVQSASSDNDDDDDTDDVVAANSTSRRYSTKLKPAEARRAASDTVLSVTPSAAPIIERTSTYAAPGSIVETVSEHKAVTPEIGLLVVDVEDTGIGIPDDKVRQLFRPFYQVEVSRTRKHGGSGLGLNISKKLAELMNGTLEYVPCSSGCHFRLQLPMPVVEWSPKSSTESKRNRMAKQGGHLTVIPDGEVYIVDDVTINRRLLSKMLTRLGIKSRQFIDGKQVVDAVCAPDAPMPFCIFMDIHMPVMDGIEATRALRRHFGGKVIVIGCSADLSDDSRKDCDALMDAFVGKPFRQQAITDVLNGFV